MVYHVIEKDNQIIYQISDYHPRYEKTLKENCYIQVGDIFEKHFPLPFDGKETIAENYLKFAKEIFEKDFNKPFKWKESLLHFAAIAKGAGIEWWTSGRTALSLYGVDIEVNDLDFIFDSKDIERVNKAFSKYIVEPILSTEGRPRSNWVKYFGTAYSHCPVCFAVEPHDFVDKPEPVHFGPYAKEHLEYVNWNDLEIRVPSFELHLKTYERWRKTDVIQKIRAYLNN